MNQLLERLRKDFQDEEARYAYADSVVSAFVSAQIRALREDRHLSQEELAELLGTKQSGVSRLEREDYSAWKIETLRKLAKAFGVRLRVSFEEFGTLVKDIGGFKGNSLLPRRFDDDPVFKESRRSDRRVGRKIQYSNASRRQHTSRRRRQTPAHDIPKKPTLPTPYRSPVSWPIAVNEGASSSHPTGNKSGPIPPIRETQGVARAQSGVQNGN